MSPLGSLRCRGPSSRDQRRSFPHGCPAGSARPSAAERPEEPARRPWARGPGRERRQRGRGRRAPEAATVHLTSQVRGSGRCAVPAAGQPEEAECPKSLARACSAAGERRPRRPLGIRSCCSSAERSRQHTNGGIPHSRAGRARSGPAFSRINIHHARRGATLSDGGGEAEGNAARTALLLSTGSPQPWPHVRPLAFLLWGRLLPAASAARAPPFAMEAARRPAGTEREHRWREARAGSSAEETLRAGKAALSRRSDAIPPTRPRGVFRPDSGPWPRPLLPRAYPRSEPAR